MREVIRTSAAPSSPLYSQGVKIGNQIFVTGTTGVDVTTGAAAGPTIQEQTQQALENCAAILKAADATLGDVAEVGILLADPDDFGGMNEEYAKWFPENPPVRYTARLGPQLPGILVSIRMTAVLD